MPKASPKQGSRLFRFLLAGLVLLFVLIVLYFLEKNFRSLNEAPLIPSKTEEKNDTEVIPPTAASSRAQVNITLHIKAISYGSSRMTVPVGASVIWINEDTTSHTVTSANNAFDSGEILPGKTFQETFYSPGEYVYYCKIHPYVSAKIIVR